jgi:hypothetical protein
VSGVIQPAIADLETWPDLDWSGGLQIDEIDNTQTPPYEIITAIGAGRAKCIEPIVLNWTAGLPKR